jgi:hypothetical protein
VKVEITRLSHPKPPIKEITLVLTPGEFRDIKDAVLRRRQDLLKVRCDLAAEPFAKLLDAMVTAETLQ